MHQRSCCYFLWKWDFISHIRCAALVAVKFSRKHSVIPVEWLDIAVLEMINSMRFQRFHCGCCNFTFHGSWLWTKFESSVKLIDEQAKKQQRDWKQALDWWNRKRTESCLLVCSLSYTFQIYMRHHDAKVCQLQCSSVCNHSSAS